MMSNYCLGFHCTNPVIQDPETGEDLETCGYHIEICLLTHAVGSDNVIEIRNECGICLRHYQQKFGKTTDVGFTLSILKSSRLGQLPPEVSTPFPGMISMDEMKQWNAIKLQKKHWAAPDDAPAPDVISSSYWPPDQPEGYIDKMIDKARQLHHEW
jgi:hypothetical protein